MLRIIVRLVIIIVLYPLQTYAVEEEKHHLPPVKSSKEFENIKSLNGTWKGTTDMGEANQQVSITYNITSNGSAVLETLFPGTPNEMVSVYYDINGKLAMTHYCALGNQPLMELESSSENVINLKLSKNNSIDPAKDQHMYALSITFKGDNSFVQNWTSFENEAISEVHTFRYTRVE
jgi:hypothetical protein